MRNYFSMGETYLLYGKKVPYEGDYRVGEQGSEGQAPDIGTRTHNQGIDRNNRRPVGVLFYHKIVVFN